jgi:hypothetical protein
MMLLFLGAFSVSAWPDTFEDISVEAQAHCQGKFKGQEVSHQELKALLKDHEAWYKNYARHWFRTKEAQSDPRRANLCGVILVGEDLSSFDLHNVDLSGADLHEATLKNAQEANLSGAHLGGAILRGARLVGANLNGTFLSGADLSRANLADADLAHAWLEYADLEDTRFEPLDLPDVDGIASAKHLSKMTFDKNPQALFKLRETFKEAGYYRQERMVTYAIKHREMLGLFENRSSLHFRVASLFEGVFNYLLFDLTTQWGMTPGRAMWILLALIPVFAIPYVIVLRLPVQHGIWREWADDRVRKDVGTNDPMRLCLGWRQAFVAGFYFSVISAFNIGWRELNVGNWIQRLQANEYTLRPTGWVRTLSGAQSLISVYLLAIWALTYFGSPFE